MYCQSKLTLKNPSPSLPCDPPKRFVKTSEFWFARQKIEIPCKRGNIHSFLIPRQSTFLAHFWWIGMNVRELFRRRT